MTTLVQDQVTLSNLHDRTVALRMEFLGRNQLLKGRGYYDRDPLWGQVLKIEFPHEAGTEFILAENDWEGEILPGDSVGCDYLIRVV
jgi:hypothetical protein